MSFIRRTIGASLAGVMALASAGLGQAQNAAPAATPVKLRNMTITILNNSDRAIYPILSTGAPALDFWLQGAFKVPASQQGTRTYQEINTYRIYVNPNTGGIPIGGSVTLTVPLWTQLDPKSPDGSKPDQYINWWSGGRVSLGDGVSVTKTNYRFDVAKNKTWSGPVAGSPVITCADCKEELRVFRDTDGKSAPTGNFNENEPTQLTEYTLGGVNRGTNPITVLDDEVDYDISYVDSVYLPAAIEPQDNPRIGWVGTVQSVDDFKNKLRSFKKTARYTGWPTFVESADPSVAILKLPSTGFVFAAQSGAHPSPILSPSGASFLALTDNWKKCTDTTTNKGLQCVQMRDVKALFVANYASYKAKWNAANCKGGIRPLVTSDGYDYNWLLSKVYGWVPFNETPGTAACPQIKNELADTPGYPLPVLLPLVDEYKKLQYTGAGILPNGSAFNPYVWLIHGNMPPNNFLAMPYAYSFSIDDSVGNMLEKGTGLVIAVGGNKNLPNPNPYDPAKFVHVNLQKRATGETFTQYGICQGYKLGVLCPLMEPLPTDNFVVAADLYPVLVTLSDNHNKKYSFIITKAPPFPSQTSHAQIQCESGDKWCSDTVLTHSVPADPPIKVIPDNYIETGPPNAAS